MEGEWRCVYRRALLGNLANSIFIGGEPEIHKTMSSQSLQALSSDQLVRPRGAKPSFGMKRVPMFKSCTVHCEYL